VATPMVIRSGWVPWQQPNTGLIDEQDQLHCDALHYCCTFGQRKLDALDSAAPRDRAPSRSILNGHTLVWPPKRLAGTDLSILIQTWCKSQSLNHIGSRNTDTDERKNSFSRQILPQFARFILIIDILEKSCSQL